MDWNAVCDFVQEHGIVGFNADGYRAYWRLDDSDLKQIVLEGFHAALAQDRYASLRLFAPRPDAYIAECTIPAGSRYYLGHENLIVSNQMRIDRFIVKHDEYKSIVT